MLLCHSYGIRTHTLHFCNSPAINALPYSALRFSVLLQILSISTYRRNGVFRTLRGSIFFRSTTFYAKEQGLLLHYLIGTAGTGEGVGFGLEGEAHSHNVAHSFLQGIVTLKSRVGVNIRVYFHIDAEAGE